jgi:G3E family GTPase
MAIDAPAAATARDPLAGKIPVSVLTGFLGAGKTTLLNRLLKHPDMNRVAVVINELGEVGIDNDLVAETSENVTLLSNGCLCCTVRTDLQETLVDLFTRRRRGEIADFDRVVVETTGLADPAPVIQTLSTDTLLSGQFRLDGVATLVDAVNGAASLDRQPEAVKQAAVADRIVVTKSDLASKETLDALVARLKTLNPAAELATAVMGDIDPAFITNIGLRNARTDEQALARFLGRDPAAGDAGGAYLGGHLASRHDAAVKSFVLRFDEPMRWNVFSSAMELLTSLRGPDLLRVKGIVNVEGKPVVVQGVQHVFHPAVTLARWPSEDRSTRLVFITRNIDQPTVEALFRAAEGLAPPAAAPSA